MRSAIAMSANGEKRLDDRTLFSRFGNLSVKAPYYILLYSADNHKNWFFFLRKHAIFCLFRS